MIIPGKITLFTLVLLMTGITGAAAQESVDFELREVLVIGDDPDKSIEYWFRDPQKLRTDSEGNMYISDRNNATIRVFDPSGTYLRSIGRRGEGPGEFQEISSFHIDESDRLIVFDHYGQRFTVYEDPEMEEYETIIFESSSSTGPQHLEARDIHSFGQDHYALSYRNFSENPDEALLLHLFDHDLTYTGESMVEASQIWDLDVPFLRTQAAPGGFSYETDGAFGLFLCPRYYEGQVYRFTKTDEGTWNQSILTGTWLNDHSFDVQRQASFYDLQDFWRDGYAADGYSGRDGRFVVTVNSICVGVAKLNSENVIVFTHQRTPDDTYIVNADLFNEENHQIGRQVLKKFHYQQGEGLYFQLLWEDNNRFYVRDWGRMDGSSVPVIRVLEVHY